MDNLPTQTEVEIALWNLLKARPNGVTAQEAYDGLADVFELTWEQTHRKMDNDTRELHWPNRVRQAHRRLIDKRFAVGGERNHWTLTDLGKIDLELDL